MAQPVIFDTDIGTDVDDAYALALLLQCPELDLVGVTVGHGPTRQRSRIALKLLHLAGRDDIPVFTGAERAVPVEVNQAPWADDFALRDVVDQPAAEFLVETIRARPGEINLICVGPFTNLGDALALDPGLMDKARRVVVMGGCLGLPDGATPQPYPEYNAKSDPEATRSLLSACSNLTLVPLDVTRSVPLAEQHRAMLAESEMPLPRALAELYEYWPRETPLLHDPLAVGMVVSERFCLTRAMPVSVDEDGSTRVSDDGTPMTVCIAVKADTFVHFFISRLLRE